MKEKHALTQFAVIGLGRFGMSIVKTLSAYDVHILACDANADKLHLAANYATHVVQVDASDEDALARLGLGNFDVVVLAMGVDFEASLLATLKAKELGARTVVVKAFGQRQKQIFESVGADMVVLPEQEMGQKIAHRLMRPNILDVLENLGQFQITEMRPLDEWVGRTVGESDIRQKHGMTLLAIIRSGDTIIPVLPEERIAQNDILVALAEAHRL